MRTYVIRSKTEAAGVSVRELGAKEPFEVVHRGFDGPMGQLLSRNDRFHDPAGIVPDCTVSRGGPSAAPHWQVQLSHGGSVYASYRWEYFKPYTELKGSGCGISGSMLDHSFSILSDDRAIGEVEAKSSESGGAEYRLDVSSDGDAPLALAALLAIVYLRRYFSTRAVDEEGSGENRP